MSSVIIMQAKLTRIISEALMCRTTDILPANGCGQEYNKTVCATAKDIISIWHQPYDKMHAVANKQHSNHHTVMRVDSE